MPENASWGRRILALIIDWFACWAAVAYFVGWDVAFAGPEDPDRNPAVGLYVTLTWICETTVFTSLLSGSFGQLVSRLRVVRLDGGRLDPFRALVRSVMIALVIPPLVFRADGRGLHDMVVGTRVARLD